MTFFFFLFTKGVRLAQCVAVRAGQWPELFGPRHRRRRRVVVPVRRRADELTGALRRLSGGRRGTEMRSNGARARKGQGADPCRRIAQLGC